MYITIKLTDDSVRLYEFKQDAMKDSIRMNLRETSHPSFHLYKSNGSKKATFLGRLCRKFGTNDYY